MGRVFGSYTSPTPKFLSHLSRSLWKSQRDASMHDCSCMKRGTTLQSYGSNWYLRIVLQRWNIESWCVIGTSWIPWTPAVNRYNELAVDKIIKNSLTTWMTLKARVTSKSESCRKRCSQEVRHDWVKEICHQSTLCRWSGCDLSPLPSIPEKECEI